MSDIDKELKERIAKLINAVAHIGVDMGDCEFYLTDIHIQEARELMAILKEQDDE